MPPRQASSKPDERSRRRALPSTQPSTPPMPSPGTGWVVGRSVRITIRCFVASRGREGRRGGREEPRAPSAAQDQDRVRAGRDPLVRSQTSRRARVPLRRHRAEGDRTRVTLTSLRRAWWILDIARSRPTPVCHDAIKRVKSRRRLDIGAGAAREPLRTLDSWTPPPHQSAARRWRRLRECGMAPLRDLALRHECDAILQFGGSGTGRITPMASAS